MLHLYARSILLTFGELHLIGIVPEARTVHYSLHYKGHSQALDRTERQWSWNWNYGAPDLPITIHYRLCFRTNLRTCYHFGSGVEPIVDSLRWRPGFIVGKMGDSLSIGLFNSILSGL
jgi:hypothetical protein